MNAFLRSLVLPKEGKGGRERALSGKLSVPEYLASQRPHWTPKRNGKKMAG